jgi:hypothetical protein
LLSVVVHGATSDPLASRYARLVASKADQVASKADQPAGAGISDIPERRLIRRT